MFPFSVQARNLAVEGKAYHSLAFGKKNASKAIDGQTQIIFSDDSCITSRRQEKIWWRVDFAKLIEVYAVQITPGKLHMLQTF